MTFVLERPTTGTLGERIALPVADQERTRYALAAVPDHPPLYDVLWGREVANVSFRVGVAGEQSDIPSEPSVQGADAIARRRAHLRAVWDDMEHEVDEGDRRELAREVRSFRGFRAGLR